MTTEAQFFLVAPKNGGSSLDHRLGEHVVQYHDLINFRIRKLIEIRKFDPTVKDDVFLT